MVNLYFKVCGEAWTGVPACVWSCWCVMMECVLVCQLIVSSGNVLNGKPWRSGLVNVSQFDTLTVNI